MGVKSLPVAGSPQTDSSSSQGEAPRGAAPDEPQLERTNLKLVAHWEWSQPGEGRPVLRVRWTLVVAE